MSQVHVTDGELRRAFGEENTRMTVDYVRFPIDAEDVGDYEPSQEEIEAYYNSHPEDYKLGERAVVRYVKIPLVASARDRDDINYTIDHIRSQLEFDDFETLAKTYSEAPTAEVGGDTGFLVRSQRDPKVMAAVDSLSDGGVSQPIWTDKGVYLVQRVETKTEGNQTKYRLREIFLSLSAGAATSDSLETVAKNVQESAVNVGLEKAAAARDLKVETTAPFVADAPIEGIGYLPSLSRYAFANDPGTISNVIGDGDNYYVCEIAERIPAGARPLDDVREPIRKALVLEHREQLAERKAEAFHRKLMTSPSDFREAAEQYGYTVGHVDTFTVRQPAGDIPPLSAFGYAAYNMTVGAESPPVESNGSYYVIHLLDRTPFDDAAYQQQADAVRSRLLQRKAQAYIDYWYQNLRDNAQIEDYRGAL
jgi:peptidyl-prolyl cis-trans isomerase D